MTEDSKPVGSGAIIYSSFSYYLIFCSFTSASPACASSRVWACSHTPFSESWVIPPLSPNESEKGPSLRPLLSSSSNERPRSQHSPKPLHFCQLDGCRYQAKGAVLAPWHIRSSKSMDF